MQTLPIKFKESAQHKGTPPNAIAKTIGQCAAIQGHPALTSLDTDTDFDNAKYCYIYPYRPRRGHGSALISPIPVCKQTPYIHIDPTDSPDTDEGPWITQKLDVIM